MRLYGANCTLTAATRAGGRGTHYRCCSAATEGPRSGQKWLKSGSQSTICICSIVNGAGQQPGAAEELTVWRSHKAQPERADPRAHGGQSDLNPELALQIQVCGDRRRQRGGAQVAGQARIRQAGVAGFKPCGSGRIHPLAALVSVGLADRGTRRKASAHAAYCIRKLWVGEGPSDARAGMRRR